MYVTVLFCFFQGPRLSSAGFETPLASFEARREKEEVCNEQELQERRGAKAKRRLAFDVRISMASKRIGRNIQTGTTTLRSKMEVRTVATHASLQQGSGMSFKNGCSMQQLKPGPLS